MENPASRKRVAEQRIKQVVDPKLEKAKIGINKDKIARTTAKRQAEKQALENIIKEADEQMKPQQEALEQKKQLAEETKKLTEKRKNSKSREEKKELTKKIDENQDAFEKLTYEEAGELFSKPKEVEEMEAKEQAEKDEFNKAMDENETPQDSVDEIINEEHYLVDTKKYNPWKVNIAEREVKHENPQEKDIWTDSEGEEITFYHGTPNGGFEEFDLSHRGESNDRVGLGDYGRGMYFTPYKETAKGYAKHSKAGSKNPEIYETKLRMENPLRLDLFMKYQKARRELDKKDLERGYNLVSKEHGQNVDRLLEEFGFTEELYDKYDELISAIGDNRMDFDIRAQGFDGIISEDGKEVIVPDTKQIVVNKHYSTNPTLESLKYNKSKDPNTVELEVYKGRRGYPIKNTPGAKDEVTFYTDNEMRANQFGPTTKETITLPKDKVKIIDSEGLSFSSKVDKDGNVVKGRAGDTEDNYVNYNNKKAREEGYEAIIYKDIIDIGPNRTKDIVEKADDIVLLKREAPKKETPKTEEKKVESKKEKGSEPLVQIESDMSIYKEPIVGDFKTQEIFDRMEYIKNQAKEKGKLYAKEATELKFLQDLYKRQVEWEGREKQGDITDEDYVKAYETGGGGVDKAPF